jgi:hypothetical protein
MPIDIRVDDEITLKKPHACGANAWLVYRVGADIGLRCLNCNHRIMLPRTKVERRLRLITREGESFKPQR